MNQGITLSNPLCARNAGIGILGSALISSVILFSLGTIFQVPGEATLTVARNMGVLSLVVIIFVFIMAFFNLMVTAASYNAFKSVNKDLASLSSIFRSIMILLFIMSIVLLFAQVPFFKEVFLISHVVYFLHCLVLGYLVFKSGVLHQGIGIFLVIGGLIGYLLESLTHFYIASFIWLSSIGLLVAVVAEIVLGIILIMKANEILNDRPDPKKTITTILEDLGEATTADIIDEASKKSRECKDRVPNTLVALEKENRIIKRISKEKRAVVWMLAS